MRELEDIQALTAKIERNSRRVKSLHAVRSQSKNTRDVASENESNTTT